jgi:hypothetical protein
MAKALIIKTDGTHEVKDFTVGNSYELIREGVGGWIECVALPELNADMWVNEEGKLVGLPFNASGTALWVSHYGLTDIILGDIVITGGADDEGDTIGLTEEALAKVLALVA